MATTHAGPRSAGWFGAAAGMFAVAWGANQFVSMLVGYEAQRGISTAVNDGLFGIYALALIVALLLCGPAADLYGRAKVVRPAVAVSFVASVLLMAGDHSVGLLFAGRFVAGAASGAIFAAGTAWVKELSVGEETAGARRAALALSAGFGLGPLVAGVVAQFAPAPLVTAYVPHLVITALALPLVLRVPETLRSLPGGPTAAGATAAAGGAGRAGGAGVARGTGRGYRSRLRVPSAGHARFLRVVLPAAPWVFAAPAVAFAVLPSLVSDHVGDYALLFSAAIAGLTLGVGVAIQPLARRLDRPGRVLGALLGLAAVTVGMCLASWAASRSGSAGAVSPWLAVLASVPLGAGYGLGLVSGLLETQRIAAPDELAGLTGVYYSLTYVGFALPLILAAFKPVAGYDVLLLVVAAVALACGLTVWRGGATTQPGRLRSESAAELR